MFCCLVSAPAARAFCTTAFPLLHYFSSFFIGGNNSLETFRKAEDPHHHFPQNTSQKSTTKECATLPNGEKVSRNLKKHPVFILVSVPQRRPILQSYG
jgi:hypothetical protein